LKDLELAKFKMIGIAIPICGDLNQVFETRDQPTDKNRDVPPAVSQVFQMPVPSKRHENIG
jgi:hypothetical protein